MKCALLAFALAAFALSHEIAAGLAAAPPATTATPAPAASSLQQQLDAGQRAFDKNDYDAAIKIWQAGLAEAQKENNSAYVAKFLTNIGNADQNLDRYPEALASLQEALALDRALGDRHGEALDLQDIAVVQEHLSHYPEALVLFQQALAIARGIHNRQSEADDLGGIGVVQGDLSHYSEALADQRQALAIAGELGDRSRQVKSLINIGLVEIDFSDYSKALASFKQALGIAHKIHDRVSEARIINNTGIIDEDLSRHDDALRAFQQALTIVRQLHRRRYEATVLTDIAVVQTELGQYTQSLATDNEALAISREIGDRSGEEFELGNVSQILEKLGRYTEALSIAEQALAIDRQIGDRDGEASDLTSAGRIQEDLGRYQDAFASYEEALSIARSIHDRKYESVALVDLANAQADLGRFAAALITARQALAFARELGTRATEASVLGNIANLQVNLGRYREALGSSRQAFAVARHIHDILDEANALINASDADWHLGLFEDERNAAAESLRLLKELGHAEVWQALYALASAEAKLGEETNAQAHYEGALDQIERLRAELSSQSERTSFLGTALFVYDEYIAYLRELNRRHPGKGYDHKALQILERKAARSALEQIGASAAQRFSGVPADLVEQETLADAAVGANQDRYSQLLADAHADKIALRSAKSDLDTALKRHNALDAQAKARYPEYYALRHPQPIGLAQLQRDVLKPGEALLVYDLLDGHSVLWLITQRQFQFLTLPGNKEIDAAVSAMAGHIGSIQSGSRSTAHDLPGFARDSYALYSKLIPKRAWSTLAAAKSLVVVPSGSLYEVPFEALVTHDPARTARPRYLIADLPISYAPSASLLGVVSRSYSGHRSAAQPLLAFAKPTFSQQTVASKQDTTAIASMQINSMRAVVAGGTFASLPETQTEANAVREALHAPTDSVISGEDATRALVLNLNGSGRLAGYRYLLFATHAVLPDQIKGLTQPAIVLAHPERGDGFLTMADIFGLKLNADFVTLSACDTGVVANPSGDGISGLTRAFLYAGTPAISVTLWQVDDAAAPQITPPFFAAMQSGKTAAQALRAAQLAMIRSDNPRFSHPFAWAPFVIFGDGDLAPPMQR